MSFEYLADPSRPAWAGLLPGKPEAYFLAKGEGEHVKLFADSFSVLPAAMRPAASSASSPRHVR